MAWLGVVCPPSNNARPTQPSLPTMASSVVWPSSRVKSKTPRPRSGNTRRPSWTRARTARRRAPARSGSCVAATARVPPPGERRVDGSAWAQTTQGASLFARALGGAAHMSGAAPKDYLPAGSRAVELAQAEPPRHDTRIRGQAQDAWMLKHQYGSTVPGRRGHRPGVTQVRWFKFQLPPTTFPLS